MTLLGCGNSNKTPEIGQLELVSEINMRPGNVTASKDGRVFSTIHPLNNPNIQIVEYTGKNSYELFPSKEWQKNGKEATDKKFDSPFGILLDSKNNLWTIDAGFNLGKIRLFAFNIDSKELVYKFELPKEALKEGSFVQDLAIDEINNYSYLADLTGAIIFINMNNNTARRFKDEKMKSENIDMVIDNKTIIFGNRPARVGINPIALSKDNKTLYFGSMNGTKWYNMPTSTFIDNKVDEELSMSIKVTGKKTY